MSRTIGEYSREITIYDPDARTITGPDLTVTGNAPPGLASSWWPWVVAAAVLGGLWYITREDERSGPLAGGAG